MMKSKSIGADLAYAWPTAELAVIGPQGAVEIVYRRELQQAADPVARRAELVNEYTTQPQKKQLQLLPVLKGCGL